MGERLIVATIRTKCTCGCWVIVGSKITFDFLTRKTVGCQQCGQSGRDPDPPDPPEMRWDQ